VKSYAFQAVLNGFPSVDTFFILSGVLVSYLLLKELDKTKGRVNWIMFYVHRYLRYLGEKNVIEPSMLFLF
jgi:peptidoglycan/LPS O-acetylase OafA/YrhL